MAMILISIFFLMVTSTMASDLCGFLNNGSIRLYRKFGRIGSEVVDSYLMLRRDSTEMWEISVKSDDSNGVKIGFGDRSKEVNDLNVTQRFDIIVTDGMLWKCSVKKEVSGTDHWVKIYCSNQSGTQLKSSPNVIDDDYMVLHANPSNTSVVIARHKKANVVRSITLSADKVELIDYQRCDWIDDRCPPFLKNMNRSLSRQMEAIVGLDMSPMSGHLVLFNIKGRHKYCYQSYGNENQSKTCHSLDDLKTFAPQCEANDDTDEDNNEWLIAIVVVIAMLVILGIGFWYCLLRNQSQTNDQSVRTLDSKKKCSEVIATSKVEEKSVSTERPMGSAKQVSRKSSKEDLLKSIGRDDQKSKSMT